MPASFAANVSGTTITVTLTVAAGSSYGLNTAAVQVMINPTGGTLSSATDTIMGNTRTVTFNGSSGVGYTVLVACGGETGRSTVQVGKAQLAII
jgi:hypothetical protein